MAPNKFATMVHNNTNKITLVLIYALLEWTLITLLFLNSIFQHLIIKFTQFFGLKPPCIWCTRLDRLFEPDNKNSYRDLLCETHSKEISLLGLCLEHNKLAESHGMCPDCSLEKFECSGESGGKDEVGLKCSCCGVDFVTNLLENGNSIIDPIGSGKYEVRKQGKETEETEVELLKQKESISEKLAQDLEFFLDYSGNQLVPIDPIDEDQEFGDFQEAESKTETEIVTEKTEDSSKFAELDSMEFEETENSLVFHVNLNSSGSEPSQTVQETGEGNSEDEEAEVSIGTEIPVLDSIDEKKAKDNFDLYSSSHEEPSTSSNDLEFTLENGFEEAREDEKIEDLNLNEVERKESVLDESLDGSEVDGGDSINTTEKLKLALRAERKALQALYTELEEERSASAVAASETMAMINRLQEEKAAMQMEALHYQRMMEEQSEYDQEALQLLNELMVKKEKELELYRKRVLEYEAKERLRFSTSSVKSVTCSGSCSHSDDGDGMWVEVNHESKEEGINDVKQESENGNHNPPLDAIVDQDSSFVDYEDERLSILAQLKVLEEKLFTLSDEEDRHFSELREIEDYFEENGNHLNGDNGQQVNGTTNGFPNEPHEIDYQDRRVIGSMRNKASPPIGRLETESDDGAITSNGNGNGFHSSKVENVAITMFELQKRRIDIEEEVDQLYVRLQAIEADREFLKHCVGSLKKGDKGMKLLQEILQHLRDLKNVDLRAQSFTDGTLV